MGTAEFSMALALTHDGTVNGCLLYQQIPTLQDDAIKMSNGYGKTDIPGDNYGTS